MGRAFEVRKQSMAKTAAAKSKVYAKYGREIYVAAKSGLPDPEINVSLKRVIERAKKDQVPTDIIKRAIDKAKGGSEENYSDVRYEGFSVSGIQVIVECLTDNVNRTFHEVRNAFTKTDGKLGVSGSVIHMFKHQSVFSIENSSEDEVLELLIENDLDVEDIETEENVVSIYTDVSNYNNIKTALLTKVSEEDVIFEQIMWIPTQEVENINDEDKIKFDKLIQMLDEIDDVQNVYHNLK